LNGKPNRIDELNRLLNSIYKIDENIEFNGNTSSSLDDIYSNYHNFKENFQKTKNIVENICSGLTIFLKRESYIDDIISNLNLPEDNERKSRYVEIPTHFNDIWLKRFKSLERNRTIHRFEYRKEVT